jgi:hypothetical protein
MALYRLLRGGEPDGQRSDTGDAREPASGSSNFHWRLLAIRSGYRP